MGLRDLVNFENIRGLLIVGVWIFIFCAMAGVFSEDVKVGQTWKSIHDERNPFSDTNMVHTKRVVDVKNNYVLYVFDGKDTLSKHKARFRSGYELVFTKE